MVSYKEKVGERQGQTQKLKHEAENKLVMVPVVVAESSGFVVLVGCREFVERLSRGCREVVTKLLELRIDLCVLSIKSPQGLSRRSCIFQIRLAPFNSLKNSLADSDT